jgi:hypothetical protein
VLKASNMQATIQLRNGSNEIGKVGIPIPIKSGDKSPRTLYLLFIAFMIIGLWVAYKIISSHLFFVVVVALLALEFYFFRILWNQAKGLAARYVVVRAINKYIIEEGDLILLQHETGIFVMINGNMTGVVSHPKTYEQWDLGADDSFVL